MKKITILYAALCVILLAFSFSGKAMAVELPEVSLDERVVSNPAHTFQTIDGGEISTDGSSKKATVLIFGRTTCYNSKSTVKSVSDSDWAVSEDVRVVFAEYDGATLEDTRAFAEANGSSAVTFCYDTGTAIKNVMWEYVRLGNPGQNSVFLPVVALIDSDNKVQKVMEGIQSADGILTEIQKFTEIDYVDTDPKISIALKGTENYDYAKRIAEIVNQERKKENPELSDLTLDTELTEAAMQRAAEIAIYYSHTRPDGDSCFTVIDRGTASAENIAVNQRSPEKVMEDWMNSPGHHANIMKDNMASIGVGCFQDDKGIWYWVQYFDNAVPSPLTKTGAKEVMRTIRTSTSNFSLGTGQDETFSCGDRAEGTMEVYNVNSEFIYSKPALEASDFTFTSSDDSIATVDENGTVTMHRMGTATITAALKGNPAVSVSKDFTKVSHSWGEPIWTWKGDTAEVTFICGRDNTHVERPEVTVTSEVTREPGCGIAGVRTCTATAEFGGQTYTDTKTEVIAAISHNYQELTNKATTKDDGKTVKKCTICGETVSLAVIPFPKTIKLSKTSVIYNGKAQKPSVIIKDSKGQTIASTNYTITYTANKNPGTATVAITFTGNYSGTVKKTFQILPKGTALAKVKAQKNGFQLTWKKQTSQTTGYQIQYSTSKNFKGAKTVGIAKNKTTTKSIARQKANKKYYVRIRTYKKTKVNGKTTMLYSTWSKAKAVTTKK